MGNRDQELLKRLLAIFKGEAEEHVSAISSGLIELEGASSPDKQMRIVEGVFRRAHSLKGAARSVNLVKVESTCQSLETLFAQLKAHEIALSPELFDQLHRAVDTLGSLLFAASTEETKGGRSREIQIPDPASAALKQRGSKPTEAVAAPAPQAREPVLSENAREAHLPVEDRLGLSHTLRVPMAKVDSLLRQVEELIPAKATASQRVTELREIGTSVALWEKEWEKVRLRASATQWLAGGDLRPGMQRRVSNGQEASRSQIVKAIAFCGRKETMLLSAGIKLAILAKQLENDARALDRKVDDLVEDTRRLSMLSFSAFLESFPKLVRDLCRDCGKDAVLVITGGEIEASRRVLEEIKDPLVHLVRNCVDHGIESPRQREERQKPSRATITIAITPQNSDKVEITISDDGAGIDVQKVRAAAAKLKVISQEEAQNMNEQQALFLVFQSGVSTSPLITDVSGRGLGLAIVREKAEKVGGCVSVETQLGGGTTFRLLLPLTLARFRGILVRVGDGVYLLPTIRVLKVLRVDPDEIKSVENRETIRVNGEITALVRLEEVLKVTAKPTLSDPKRKLPALVLSWAGEQMAFLVDEILNEQEVVVKSLGRQLRHVRNIAGATILGTGKVLPVLDVADLMRSAVNTVYVPRVLETKEAPKSILVAEDSITARTLVKNILEFAGYRVKTAVDGAEAFLALGVEAFDLVVSDVDMPKMSGFDLTAKIRADKRFSELPVVLVTALDSPEDREHGADVGANAYLVKSSFDQGNLLEVVRRLI